MEGNCVADHVQMRAAAEASKARPRRENNHSGCFLYPPFESIRKNEQNKRQDIYVIELAASGHGLKTVHRTVFLTAFRRRFAPPHQLHRDGTTVIDSSSKLRNKKKKQVF